MEARQRSRWLGRQWSRGFERLLGLFLPLAELIEQELMNAVWQGLLLIHRLVAARCGRGFVSGPVRHTTDFPLLR